MLILDEFNLQERLVMAFLRGAELVAAFSDAGAD
jgi:hypothetical protein